MDLSADEIRSYVGSTSYSRGRDYLTSGAVLEIEVEDDAIAGLVQGSQKRPYRVSIDVEEGEIIGSLCSCPVAYACKHVAALALKAILVLAKNPQIITTPNPKQPNSPPKNNWQSALKKLIPDTKKENIFELQILLNITEEMDIGNFYYLLNGSYRTPRNLKHVLKIRPRLFDPATGSYSVSQISWQKARSENSTIYWNGQAGVISDKHFAYLTLLARGVLQNYSDGWMEVPKETATFVFEILQKHSDYGVTLLGGEKGKLLVIFKDEPVKVILEITDQKNGLNLSKKIYDQGKDITKSATVIIGKPFAFAATLEDSIIVSPVEYSTHSNELEQFEKTITIPKAEIKVFEQKFLPQIFKSYPVRLEAKTISLPDKVFPQPFISIKPIKKQNIQR